MNPAAPRGRAARARRRRRRRRRRDRADRAPAPIRRAPIAGPRLAPPCPWPRALRRVGCGTRFGAGLLARLGARGRLFETVAIGRSLLGRVGRRAHCLSQGHRTASAPSRHRPDRMRSTCDLTPSGRCRGAIDGGTMILSRPLSDVRRADGGRRRSRPVSRRLAAAVDAGGRSGHHRPRDRRDRERVSPRPDPARLRAGRGRVPPGTARSIAASRGRRASPSPRSPWPAPW